LAGAVFGLEVLAIGRLRYDALIPCLIAAVIGDWTCSAWGVQHTPYHVAAADIPKVDLLLCGQVLLASLAFALAAVLFAEIAHGLGFLFKKYIRWAPARPFVGGVAVICLTWLVGTDDYLGLGVPIIVQSFAPGGVATWAFFWKIVFTTVTLGAGFKGGEVTPLFFIGATLGCTLAPLLGLPTAFLAALGFVAVFAGAANTPLASTLMGVELFGAELAVPLALACCSAYVWSGHRGIYLSQRMDTPKADALHPVVHATLGAARIKQEAQPTTTSEGR
jgi:H+/Cl- antiporter ClcA